MKLQSSFCSSLGSSFPDVFETLRGLKAGLGGEIQLAEGVEMVMPGDNAQMSAKLIVPVALHEGLRFAIREGGHTIGAGAISKVIK